MKKKPELYVFPSTSNPNLYIDLLKEALSLQWRLNNASKIPEVVRLVIHLCFAHPGSVLLNWLENYSRFPIVFPLMILLLEFWISRGGRVFVIFHNKAPHTNFGSARFNRSVFRYLKLAHRIITHSSCGVEILEKSGIDKSKVRFVHHGRYPFSFKPQARTPGPLRFVIFGKIVAYKNVDSIIRSFQNVSGAYQLSIYGECRDKVLAAQIAKLITFDTRTRWHNRFLSDDEAINILSDYDFMVIGNGGNTVLTSGTLIYSLSIGLPVLGPDLIELVDYRHTSYYLAFAEWNDLTSIIEMLLTTSDTEQLATYKLNAFRRSLEWDWKKIADILVD